MSSGVEFDEDSFAYGRPKPGSTMPHASNQPASGYSSAQNRFNQQQQAAEGSKMERWLIRHGLAKSRGGAQMELIGVVILNIIITIVLIATLLK